MALWMNWDTRYPRCGTIRPTPVITRTRIGEKDRRNRRLHRDHRRPWNHPPLRSSPQHPLSNLFRRKWRESKSSFSSYCTFNAQEKKKKKEWIQTKIQISQYLLSFCIHGVIKFTCRTGSSTVNRLAVTCL